MSPLRCTPALGKVAGRDPGGIARTLTPLGARSRTTHCKTSTSRPDAAALRLARESGWCPRSCLVLPTAMARIRSQRRAEGGIRMQSADSRRFYATPPFHPPGAQRRAVAAAVQDMISGVPMSRLVRATSVPARRVAVACIWFAHENDCQSAFMAPTEILTEQHEQTLRTLLEPFGIRVGRLTGAMTARQKREVKQALAGGQARRGRRHARAHQRLGDVFPSRSRHHGRAAPFRRRAARRARAQGRAAAHTVMSATPIPRTPALLVWAGIWTCRYRRAAARTAAGADRAWTSCYRAAQRVHRQAYSGEGRQALSFAQLGRGHGRYPSDFKSAEEHARRCRSGTFPQHRVACIHGRMKDKDKDARMGRLCRRRDGYPRLDDGHRGRRRRAERGADDHRKRRAFRLSQLHQLRGRIGRGLFQSYCVLVSDTRTEESRRLKVRATADVFCLQIAEADCCSAAWRLLR